MPDLTNDLLRALIDTMARVDTALDTLNAPAVTAAQMGISQAPNTPFFRMGEPLVIPVSPTSASAPFPATGTVTVPANATTFRIVNPNPFSVRLRGIKAGQGFQAVTSTTGWLFLPGAAEIYGTVNPVQISVMSVDGPLASSDKAQRAGTGILELQYGSGD